MSAVYIGVAAIGAASSANTASEARSAAQGADQRRMAQQSAWNRMQDPFSAGGSREQYVPQLNKLMQGGAAGLQDDPTLRFIQSQGMQASQRHASATGTAQSGGEQMALQEQGAGIASNYFQQQYQRLASLSGASGGGGSAPMSGITPENAYDMSMSGNAWQGQLMGGLAGIYGNRGTQPSQTGGYTVDAMKEQQTSGFSSSELASWGG